MTNTSLKHPLLVGQKNITTSVNAFLILRQNDKILLMLRQNTGFLDDHWGLISGHVEIGESATEGIIREAKEEIGITVDAEDLKVVHIMHRKTSRMNIDVFFECSKYLGDITNEEPHKCGGLEFFSLSNLPENAIDYNILAIKAAEQGQFYSEWGF